MTPSGLAFIVSEAHDLVQQLKNNYSVRNLEIPTISIQPSARYLDLVEFVKSRRLNGLIVVTDVSSSQIRYLKNLSVEMGLDQSRIDFIRLTHYSASKSLSKTLITILKTYVAKLSCTAHLEFAGRRTSNMKKGVSRRRLFTFFVGSTTEPLDIPVYHNQMCQLLLAGCDNCFSACKNAAITKLEEKIVIEPDICSKCGACAALCPTGALQNSYLTDLQFKAIIDMLARNEDALEEQTLVLTCSSSFDALSCRQERFPEGSITLELPCVAGISSLHLYLASVEGINTLVLCPNKTCPLNAEARLTHESLKIVNATRESLGKAARPLLNYTELESDGTQIISSIKESLATNVRKQNQASLSVGNRREMLLNTLAMLGDDTPLDGLAEVSGSTSPFYDLKIEGRCTLCKACVVNCPASALDVSSSHQKDALTFNPSLCIGCKICFIVCPEKAISIKRSFQPRRIIEGKPVTKAEEEIVKCMKCGLPVGSKKTIERITIKMKAPAPRFLSSVQLCPTCKQSIEPITDMATDKVQSHS